MLLITAYLMGVAGVFFLLAPWVYFAVGGGFSAVLVLIYLLVKEESRQAGRQLQWFDSGYEED
jgi:hypothetical protein